MSKLSSSEWADLNLKTIEFYKSKHIRLGQSYMNALWKVSEDLYNVITGTDNDPFYNDDNLTNFINFLKS